VQGGSGVRTLLLLTFTSMFLPGLSVEAWSGTGCPAEVSASNEITAAGFGSRGPEGGSHPSGYDPAIGAESPAPLTFDDVARLVVDLAEHLRDRQRPDCS
jgi:hypothetical protein